MEHWKNFGVPPGTYFGMKGVVDDSKLSDLMLKFVRKNTGEITNPAYLNSIMDKLIDELIKTGKYDRAYLESLTKNGVVIKFAVKKADLANGEFIVGKYTAEAGGVSPKDPRAYEMVSENPAYGDVKYVRVDKGQGRGKAISDFIGGSIGRTTVHVAP